MYTICWQNPCTGDLLPDQSTDTLPAAIHRAEQLLDSVSFRNGIDLLIRNGQGAIVWRAIR